MNTYTRAIRDILRDEYRVDGLRFFEGGNHPRAEFVYLGKTIKLTLARQPGGAELGASTIEMKLRDIRRTLGAAPDIGNSPRARRKLADMLPQLEARGEPEMALTVVPQETSQPHLTWGEARIAHYPNGSRGDPNKSRVSIFISNEGYRTFDHAAGVIIVHSGDGNFSVTPHPKNLTPRFTEDKRGWKLTAEIPATGLPGCGRVPAAAALLPGRMLIELPPDGDRKPPRKRRGARAEEPTQPAAAEDRLRGILGEVARIEAATPYRLVRRKDTGAWAWKAPLISLEPEE